MITPEQDQGSSTSSIPVAAEGQVSGLRKALEGLEDVIADAEARADQKWEQESPKSHYLPGLLSEVNAVKQACSFAREALASPTHQAPDVCGLVAELTLLANLIERGDATLVVDQIRNIRDRLAQAQQVVQAVSTSTCGMSAANEPSPSNPPPEGKVASQREAVDVLTRLIGEVETFERAPDNARVWIGGWSTYSGVRDPSLVHAGEIRAALASPTEQASDVSGLVEALSKSVVFNAYNAADPLAIRLEFETEEDRLAAANAIDLSQAQQVKL